MGKKVKKATRIAQKERQFTNSFAKNVSQKIVPTMVVDGVSFVKEETACPHLDTGIDLDKISSKITSFESPKCDDCREVVVDRRASKVKVKHGKSKGSGSAYGSKSIWVCLECGHFTCGGIGFPTTPQSHATRHAKQNHHPLAVQFANPNLQWCFPCNTLISIQTLENGERKDVLSTVVKLFKTRPSPDVEDVWFGSGSVKNSVMSVNTKITSADSDCSNKVKGLLNLGNTCFFNSILQNLLAMDKLRDYFLRLEEPVGPLSVSLKKLFLETNQSNGAKNVVNPQSLFKSVYTMAPQFKGYQQQDSHELLRFLLDGLCNESNIQNNVPKHTTNFVDTIFGGETSSSVSCLECGHTSTVYEPYLDLSLPLPTKKSSSKKLPTISRSIKKHPKRREKVVTKINKASDTSSAVGDSSQIEKNSICEIAIKEESDVSPDSLALVIYAEPTTALSSNSNPVVVSSDSSIWLDYMEPTSVSNGNPTLDSCDSTSWLDYLDPITVSVDHDAAACVDGDMVDEYMSKTQVELSSSNDHNIATQKEDPLIVQSFGNGNDVLWEDEEPRLIQESEIVLLPYEKLTSTSNDNELILSSVSCEQPPSEFDGFGGLFDEEPEVVSLGPISNKVVENGTVGTNNSESDSDEVDNTDSPVSVDKCLAYFTTSELLTKTEHAWHCEQCSKALVEQRMRLMTKLPEPVSKEAENGIPNELHNDKSNYSQVTSELGRGNSMINGERSKITRFTDESFIVQDTDSCYVHEVSDTCNNKKVEKGVSNRKNGFIGVEDDEVNSISSVKVTRDASKRIRINRVPPILTIHLKRLSQDGRGQISKLNGHVDFKDFIDLKPYMDPSCCRDRETYKYQLIGVVEHLGTMRGGHYVAYIRGNHDRLWYNACDAHVQQVSLEEVLRCEAYILFYENIS